MPSDKTFNNLGSKDWNEWFHSLARNEQIIVLIQSWAMLEISKRRLYDRLLGRQSTEEFDSNMERSFNNTCEVLGFRPKEVKQELESLVDDLTDDVETDEDGY